VHISSKNVCLEPGLPHRLPELECGLQVVFTQSFVQAQPSRQLAAAVDRRLTIQHAVEAGKRHLDFFTIVPCHSELLGSMNLMIEMVMASVAPGAYASGISRAGCPEALRSITKDNGKGFALKVCGHWHREKLKCFKHRYT
jgi:hypothetical protein